MASVAALLHRYTGEDQVRIGLSVPRTNGQGAERPWSRFRRDLVLHADVAGQPNVGELLKRTWMGIEAERGSRRP